MLLSLGVCLSLCVCVVNIARIKLTIFHSSAFVFDCIPDIRHTTNGGTYFHHYYHHRCPQNGFHCTYNAIGATRLLHMHNPFTRYLCVMICYNQRLVSSSVNVSVCVYAFGCKHFDAAFHFKLV